MAQFALIHKLPDEAKLVLVRLDPMVLESVENSDDVRDLVVPRVRSSSPGVQDGPENPVRGSGDARKGAAVRPQFDAIYTPLHKIETVICFCFCSNGMKLGCFHGTNIGGSFGI